MKKLFLAIVAISGLMYFLSCKKDINECSTCNASFAPAALKLDGVALDFKNYATIKEKNWLVSEVDEKVSQRVLEILKLESDFDPTEKIYSIVAFSQNALQSDQSLNSQNYLGAIVYYTQNNKLYTRTITLGTDKKVQADFSTMADAVSTNDYYTIGEILFKSAKSLVVFHNTANKTELIHSESRLTNNIRKSSYNRLKIVGPDAYNYNGCSACDGKGDRCQWSTTSNGSDYRCFKNCSIRFFEGYGDNNFQLAFWSV